METTTLVRIADSLTFKQWVHHSFASVASTFLSSDHLTFNTCRSKEIRCKKITEEDIFKLFLYWSWSWFNGWKTSFSHDQSVQTKQTLRVVSQQWRSSFYSTPNTVLRAHTTNWNNIELRQGRVWIFPQNFFFSEQ